MDKKVSLRIFIGMIVLYASLAGLSLFLPQGLSGTGLPLQAASPSPVQAVIAAVVILVFYGGLGLVGILLARKLGLPEIWDSRLTNRQRFLVPGLVGAGVGIPLIILDLLFSTINGVGRLPHPPFPTSVLASITAGIGEETLFRLFFISFWTWLVSRIILRGRFLNAVFAAVSVVSAIVFAISHLPTVMILEGWTQFSQVTPIIWVEMLLLNSLIALPAAYLFKKYGFLAPVGVHLWADVVWHVIWGLL